MAIDITVKAGMMHRVSLPLPVILDDHLCYGSFENESLILDEMGDGEFLVFHPDHIARGISVQWREGEQKCVNLRLPMPSTEAEIADLFAMTARIAAFWHGRIQVDEQAVSLKSLDELCRNYTEFNRRAMQDMFAQIASADDVITLYCAAWPMHMGKSEAEAFLTDLDAYAAWLHLKQSEDVWYAGAVYDRIGDGVEGCYNYLDGLPAIFMREPVPPFGFADPDTGEPLQVDSWVVQLNVGDWEHPIGRIPYVQFLARLPKEKVHPYDASAFLLDALTADEIRDLMK